MKTKQNKVKVKLLKDLTPLEFYLSKLRGAKNKGDEETINYYQLGQLYYQKIEFKKLDKDESGAEIKKKYKCEKFILKTGVKGSTTYAERKCIECGRTVRTYRW